MVTQERGRDNRMMQSSCEPIRDNSLSGTIMWSEDWVLASHSPSLVWNKNKNASEIGSRNFILCITYDVFHKFIELDTSKFCQTIQDSGQDMLDLAIAMIFVWHLSDQNSKTGILKTHPAQVQEADIILISC